MYKITSEVYNVLYAKYLQGNRVKEMVDLAGDIRGKNVLDLCCGNGRLSKEVLKRKPNYLYAIDESVHMLDYPANKMHFNVRIELITAQKCLMTLSQSFDVIFCQQAINYWFDKEMPFYIHKALSNDGVFIFNTFNKKPSVKPVTKKYEISKRSYIEVFWLVKNKVKHIQIAQGMDPHFTEFQWISPNEFRDSFTRHGFNIEIISNNATDIYVCKKNNL
jgi:ubiquinone/menaquinone biosynthesis C-methylase UbiE